GRGLCRDGQQPDRDRADAGADPRSDRGLHRRTPCRAPLLQARAPRGQGADARARWGPAWWRGGVGHDGLAKIPAPLVTPEARRAATAAPIARDATRPGAGLPTRGGP